MAHASDWQGVIASDLITLFSVGLPGLNIPGVFSVGPTFSINTQVKADLGTNLAATIAIQETFDTLEFIFPPSSGKSSLVQQNTKTGKYKRQYPCWFLIC